MRLTLTLFALALVSATTVQGAHWAACKTDRNGGGSINQQVTKDCCAAIKEHSTTHYNELSHLCQDALGIGNGINLGRFVACCGSRGAGSQGN
ncbi:related to conserved hypothetical Ustilaginaceae-specific protein [Ustilago trichophora]|uniref:Related to conserved hypothetical Ustilaginaceae-specific protein n=1 Tax=Ustilago trichophora TaxID=86804 RepID=A0A5C3EP04_9BASI|nr:related to conserved hypothetical Ustilaginaceae-specific protein [Ustilago trichophora]